MELIRCRAVCHPSVNIFSNRIGFVICHPIFLIFRLNMHNNIAQNLVELELLMLSLYFFNGFLITKIGIFGHLLEKFLMSDHDTWFIGILCVLPGVCKKWPLWVKFAGPFWPRIVPKLGQKAFFLPILQKVSTGLKWKSCFKLTRTTLRWGLRGIYSKPRSSRQF